MDCKIENCLGTVFAAGLCHKHYEEKRLANAPDCKIEGCTKRSERAGMCNQHYRAQLREEAPECEVEGCKRPQVAKGLCEPHYRRKKQFGDVYFKKRPQDWGSHYKHPLNETWKHYSRRNNLCEEWKDFWTFVDAVGDRPSPDHALRRFDNDQPIGPENWHWKEKVKSKSKAEYQREWRKRNYRRAKSNQLRKHYGITMDDFERMEKEQDYGCAICGRPETAKDPRTDSPRALAVDHCHESGKVRGLLCTHCNTVLGLIERDTEIVSKALEYYRKHTQE